MENKNFRSLFWPILIIGIGLIWLLAVLGVIPETNLLGLINLWPILLVAAGLKMLFGNRSQWVGAVIAVLVLALAVVVLMMGPALGLPAAGTLNSRSLSNPIDGATSASITIDLASQPSHFSVVNDPANLFEADVDYYGSLIFDASGSPHRFIKLDSAVSGASFNLSPHPDATWDIRLAQDVPLDLRIDGGSGSGDLNLSRVTLSALSLDVGSGAFNVVLPVGDQAYQADFIGGSGSLSIDLPANTPLTATFDGGSGSINLTLPAGAEAQVEIQDKGSGSVNLPDQFRQVSGGDEVGTWETAGFSQAKAAIHIICQDLGSGSFSLR